MNYLKRLNEIVEFIANRPYVIGDYVNPNISVFENNEDKKTFLLIHQWNKFRQIFSFDEKTVAEISSTSIDFDENIFEKLPYDSFIIDAKIGRYEACLFSQIGGKIEYLFSFSDKKDESTFINDLSNVTCAEEFDKLLNKNVDNSVISQYKKLAPLLLCKNQIKNNIKISKDQIGRHKATGNKLIRKTTFNEISIIDDRKEHSQYLNGSYNKTGREMPTHYRRGHISRYWVYPRDCNGVKLLNQAKEEIYKYIPPILINPGKTSQKTTVHFM